MTQEIKVKSKFLSTIIERGFLHQCTDLQGLDARLSFCEQKNQPLVSYIGFDCTAPSLHIGSLIQIMMLKHLQLCGHKPIVLMGGFTTKIGDPSGKDKSRPPITTEQIEFNKTGIQKVFKSFLDFQDDELFNSETDKAFIVDNSQWNDSINLVEFLHRTAAYFSVNEMIKSESVKLRLERESHLSLLEFLYSTIQAHDFRIISAYYKCNLQIGGSDQWYNITKGIELTNKNPYHRSLIGWGENYIEEKKQEIQDFHRNNDLKILPNIKEPNDNEQTYGKLFGLTTPLLTTASGAKMGKTADGAVWLNPDMLSPYDYWQFWRNVEDADVNRFFKLFTMLKLVEIEEISKLNINEQKKRLATEVATLLHGEEEAHKAADTARKVFEEGATSANLPSIEINASEHGFEIPAFKLFHLSGLCASGSEARKLIQGGGAKINDIAVASETRIINLNDYSNTPLKLSSGKKKHILISVK
jgi:tyrosyl-tRNA synthetase